jgi:hypothetical protein
MNPISRRRMLAATAAGGLGLLTTTTVVHAQSGSVPVQAGGRGDMGDCFLSSGATE